MRRVEDGSVIGFASAFENTHRHEVTEIKEMKIIKYEVVATLVSSVIGKVVTALSS